MLLKKLTIRNFTVFDDIDIKLTNGINIIVGENGTGKTHLMKVLYSFLESDTTEKNTKMPFFESLYGCFSTDNIYPLLKEKNKDMKIIIELEDKAYHFKAFNKESGLIDPESIPAEMEFELNIEGKRSKEKISTVFIPAKEMLTHSGLEKDFMQRQLPFDHTLIDLFNKVGVSELRQMDIHSQEMLDKIQDIIGGRVIYENDKYYILHDKDKISFQLEAEGFKKFALFWRLIEAGMIRPGTVIFWDEPESNINPKNMPVLVELLLFLQRKGVQIVLSTHDYVLAKYIEIKKQENDSCLFHSIYKDEFQKLSIESSESFGGLKHNPIMEAFNILLDEIYANDLGE